jgi:hypothetical protein
MNYILNGLYTDACRTPSDINEHLPTLDRLAKDCIHVTEFGVRWATSSLAWLNNDIELRSYDIERNDTASQIFTYAIGAANRRAQYIIRDVLSLPEIEETDLLFIDTRHTYRQCIEELKFSNNVRKYIVFHDTVLFGQLGEDNELGLLTAIAEFLLNNREWSVKEHYTNNNGLTVLQRN